MPKLDTYSAVSDTALELRRLSGTQGSLRQIATGCCNSSGNIGANKEIMSRSAHFARDTVTSIQLVFPNWHTSESSSSAATVEASVEYPVGTYTRVTFSGENEGSIAIKGLLYSDFVSVGIPIGALFYVRSYFKNAAGTVYSNPGRLSNANMAPTTTNLVMTAGAFGNQGYSYTPLAILGYSNRPAIAIIGDSIGNGSGEGTGGMYHGWLPRLFGPAYAFINLSADGEQVQSLVGLSAFIQRPTLLQYVTHAVNNAGTNDIGNAGRTGAQVLADMNTLFAKSYLENKRCFQATILPRTSSTDDWVTEANQTVTAAESARLTLNNSIRADGLTGVHGIIDGASSVESIENPGIWVCPNGLALPSDGVHVQARGSSRLAALTSVPVLT